MRGKAEPAKPEFDAKAHAASQERRRREETERRERARVAHDEAVARRDAYRERGYRDEGAVEPMVVQRTPPDTGPAASEQTTPATGSDRDTSPLDAVTEMEE